MSSEAEQQLDLLAIFHYVFGGLLALVSCIPMIHVFVGLMIVQGKFFDGMDSAQAPPPPAMFGWMFVIMGSIFIIAGWLVALSVLIAGRKLKARKNRLFCLVVGGLVCAFMPIGTVLGIFTLIALNKDSFKELFETSNGSRHDQLARS